MKHLHVQARKTDWGRPKKVDVMNFVSENRRIEGEEVEEEEDEEEEKKRFQRSFPLMKRVKEISQSISKTKDSPPPTLDPQETKTNQGHQTIHMYQSAHTPISKTRTCSSCYNASRNESPLVPSQDR